MRTQHIDHVGKKGDGNEGQKSLGATKFCLLLRFQPVRTVGIGRSLDLCPSSLSLGIEADLPAPVPGAFRDSAKPPNTQHWQKENDDIEN